MTEKPLPDFDFKRQIRWGMTAIFLLVSFVASWSMLAPLSSGAVASGHVVVDTNRKEIQHLDGGIVQEILVKDGDRILAGDLLVVMRSTELENEITKLTGEQLSLLAQNARLEAEFRNADKITFPSIFLDPGQKKRKLSLVQRQAALFKARKESLKTELDIYRQQIEQFREQIAGQEKQVQAYDLRIALLTEEVDAIEKLYKKGLAPQSRFFELKRRAASVLSEQAERESWIAETKIQITEKELQILQTQRGSIESISDQLSKLRANIFDVEDRLISARDRLFRSRILAPTGGIVFNSTLHTIGGVIPRGETFMEIVPIQDRLVIEAEASPLDIDIIQKGDVAKVRLSSLSAKLTPLLDGQVLNVAADRSLSQDGRPIYILRVAIPSEELSKLEGAELIPGMPVEVLIDKGEQTLVAYLLRPLTSVIFRAMKEN